MTFPIPDERKPRDRYRFELVPKPETETDNPTWPRSRVNVLDGTRLVATYDRNYSMLKTFEPFRQLRDNEWRDYALISKRYTRLEVMDLQTGEVIAVEEPPRMTAEWQASILAYSPESQHAGIRERHPIGMERPDAGFCPTGFYVPDWWDIHDGSIRPGDKYWDKSDETPTGEWGVYSGCVWGDDSSYKLQYVDLSRVSEGVVTTDDRFGYLELPDGLELKDAVRYETELDRLRIAVDVTFDRSTGQAPRWGRDYLNWELAQETEEPHDD